MNPIAEEIASIRTNAEDDSESLEHYGMPRRSGRYPWGSGKDPQRNFDFISRVEELRKQNFTYTDDKGKTYTGDTAIAKSMGMSTTEFRTEYAVTQNERKSLNIARARSLAEDGLGATEIGRQMGVAEGTIRGWLKESASVNPHQAQKAADFLKEQVDTRGMIDVTAGVEYDLNITPERLKQALYLLKREGYEVYDGGIPQVTNPGKQTTQRVLCPPGTQHKEIYQYDKVHSLTEYTSHDNGETFRKFEYPESLDSKRLMIRYENDVGPDGARGIDKDGIIELRRGVKDLSLGNDHYSQVRIMVDGTHYLKGMAVYSDNMPDGVDVIFNTNKGRDKSMHEVLKEIKKDPDNPFGALIKEKGGQYHYIDENGNERLGLINKKSAEGDWSDWKDTLPAQFLSKQSRPLAKKQLGESIRDKQSEFDAICELTNPTIKKHLLDEFASSCDSAAVDLKAAALPGQKYHVIIPINTLTDKECYAPNYPDGTKLALVRYPHAGTFEIPVVTVNNKHAPAKNLLGPDSIDAIGINKNIADRLSGADFDGDTVMAIPTDNGKVKILRRPALEGLEGFDPKVKYGPDMVTKDEDGNSHAFRNGKEYRIMKNTQTEMGIISNLITDMTLFGASDEEMERAVRHSMVVIDAEKHKLDYKQSEMDNNIAALKKTWQVKVDENGNYVRSGGASTIISRSKGEYDVLKRQGSPKVNTPDKEWYNPNRPEGSVIYETADDAYYPVRKYDKETRTVTYTTVSGKKISYNVDDKDAREKYEPIVEYDKKTGNVTCTNKDGTIAYKVKPNTQKSTRMAETDDAYTLISNRRHPMEVIYADYANTMKDMANRARIEMVNSGKIAYSKTAKATYQAEVDSLMRKLDNALMNAPIEREAQRRANVEVATKQANDPDMKKSDLKKAKQQAITKHRNELGALSRKKRNIDITDREWEAIQAGAISENKLKKILANTDVDVLRERATPRNSTTLSQAKITRIKHMQASNLTIAQMANALNVSPSTISKYLKEE